MSARGRGKGVRLGAGRVDRSVGKSVGGWKVGQVGRCGREGRRQLRGAGGVS